MINFIRRSAAAGLIAICLSVFASRDNRKSKHRVFSLGKTVYTTKHGALLEVTRELKVLMLATKYVGREFGEEESQEFLAIIKRIAKSM